jgi:hypothetical protein
MAGVQIPNGSVASYQGQWPHSLTGGDDIAAVGAQLLDDGLTIASSSTSGSFLGAFGGLYTVNLQIVNQSGQELDDTDLLAQVADAVLQVTGSIPASGAVTGVTGAGIGVNSGTGTFGNVSTQTAAGAAIAAANPPSTAHQCGDPTWGFTDDPVQWLKCLTTGGLTTVGLLAIGLVIGIVLIVTAPKLLPRV